MVLIYSVPNITDVTQTFDNDESLNSISASVSAIIYGSLLASRNITIDNFRNIVTVG